jgi:hypothetical protein
MLIRAIGVVAGLLVVLYVIRLTALTEYTECDRQYCGPGWDVFYTAWLVTIGMLVALLASALVRWFGRHLWRARAD